MGSNWQTWVGNKTNPNHIFVQEGSGGTFVRDTTGNYTLTITNAIPYTLYFSDRPAQETGFVPTDKFTTGFDWNPKNPPNALIMVRDAGENEDMVVVRLTTPRYNETEHTITYKTQITSNATIRSDWTRDLSRKADASIPERFDQVNLVIDDCGCTLDPSCRTWCHGACWSWRHINCEPCDGCCSCQDSPMNCCY